MTPIYYKSKKSGDLFMLEILTKDNDELNSLLDDYNEVHDPNEKITKEQFETAYPQYMVADLYDADGVFVTGKLYSKYVELEDSDK